MHKEDKEGLVGEILVGVGKGIARMGENFIRRTFSREEVEPRPTTLVMSEVKTPDPEHTYVPRPPTFSPPETKKQERDRFEFFDE